LKSSKPFGNKIAKKFNIGDLVYWNEWKKDKNDQFVRIVNHGILINIIRKVLGEREVTFACVLPMKTDQTIELNITRIRKM